jgi:hypothetical protein
MGMPMIGKAFWASTLIFASAFATAEQEFEAEIRARAVHMQEPTRDGRAASFVVRAAWHGHWHDTISTLFEWEHVETGWKDDHSDGLRFNGAVFMPDVESSELNQAALKFQYQQWQINLGRQKINLDRQRFIGSNSFWQNEQTFDALDVQYDFLSASHIRYLHIANVNRIFGDDADEALSMNDVNYGANNGMRPANRLGDHKHNTHALLLRLAEWDFSELQFYYYDIDNRDLRASSNRTFGANYRFEKRISAINWRAELEYAQQQMTEFNSSNPSYQRVEFAAGYKSREISYQREVLGGDNGRGFVTPLASIHEFNGWADQFVTVPGTGLIDQNVQFVWRKAPVKFDLRHHWFESEQTGTDWGREFDLDFTIKLNRQQRFLLRLSDFRSSSISRANFPSEKRVFFNYIVEL